MQQQQQQRPTLSQPATLSIGVTNNNNNISNPIPANINQIQRQLISSTSNTATAVPLSTAASHGLHQQQNIINTESAISAQSAEHQGVAANDAAATTHVSFENINIDQGEDLGGGPAGTRWPREETMALLKIRAEMDHQFRDSSVKKPLWEEVSRKLRDLGYERSAKKCKEKFENVNKYYKRTKGAKAGRQDGKNYRFFTQLEALQTSHSSGNPSVAAQSAINPGTSTVMAMNVNPSATSTAAVATTATAGVVPSPGAIGGSDANRHLASQQSLFSRSGSFGTALINAVMSGKPSVAGAAGSTPGTTASAIPTRISAHGVDHSASERSSGDEEDEDMDDDEDDIDDDGDELEDDDVHDDGGDEGTRLGSGLGSKSKKRKRKRGGMVAFFEGLLRKILEKQEQMQQRLLDALEKRETDRMIREEAWRRQEIARLNKEHELRAQERSSAANRDAAIVAFLQKVTGQPITLPTQHVSEPIAAQPVQSAPPLNRQSEALINASTAIVQLGQSTEAVGQFHQPNAGATTSSQPEPMTSAETFQHDTSVHSEDGHDQSDPSSKRWLKPEVLALIKLHSNLQSKFSESGPKGPLWEEISTGMAKLGYPNRSAKRCKEKWENINKYFKKTKESNKKRPENSKTCPYYHELDALYKKGAVGPSSTSTQPTIAKQDVPYKPTMQDPHATDSATNPDMDRPSGNVEGGMMGATEAATTASVMPVNIQQQSTNVGIQQQIHHGNLSYMPGSEQQQQQQQAEVSTSTTTQMAGLAPLPNSSSFMAGMLQQRMNNNNNNYNRGSSGTATTVVEGNTSTPASLNNQE